MQPTEPAKQDFRQRAPRNAVILAAGSGMRMVPINLETPKALLEVGGKPAVKYTAISRSAVFSGVTGASTRADRVWNSANIP